MTLTSKSTAGNWLDKDGQIYQEETGKTLAVIPYYDDQNEEHKATAKVLAASRSLLEALEGIMEYAENEARYLSETDRDNNNETDFGVHAYQAIEKARAAINKAKVKQ